MRKRGLVGGECSVGKANQMRVIVGLEEPDASRNVTKVKPNMKIAFLSREFSGFLE